MSSVNTKNNSERQYKLISETLTEEQDLLQKIIFQNQNNFIPAIKFSFPSAAEIAFGDTKLRPPAGYSLKQFSEANP